MMTWDLWAVGWLVLGLLDFAQLGLSGRMRKLDPSERFGRGLLGAAFVCYGAGRLAPADAVPHNMLPGLALVLAGGSAFEAFLRIRRERHSRRSGTV